MAYHPPASQRRQNRTDPAGPVKISFFDKWMTTSGTQITGLLRRSRHVFDVHEAEFGKY